MYYLKAIAFKNFRKVNKTPNIIYSCKYIVMKKTALLFVIQFFVFQVFSQEKCVNKETSFIDLNSINKCEITETKKDVNIAEASISNIVIKNKRYLKKRELLIPRVISISKTLRTKKVQVNLKENLLNKDKLKITEEIIPFNSVDEIPLFLSCKDASINKQDCFNYEMEKHIVTHFNYPKKALERNIEGDLKVSFVISIEGEVKSIKVVGDNIHEVLKQEAERIVSMLPNFVPGKHDGVEKEVLYSFPMSFKLD